MAQLYCQNPKLGYHMMRLVVARLIHDVEKAREYPNPGNKQIGMH